MNAIGRDEEALQSIEQAYELDNTYNPEYRELLLAWDEDSWEDFGVDTCPGVSAEFGVF